MGLPGQDKARLTAILGCGFDQVSSIFTAHAAKHHLMNHYLDIVDCNARLPKRSRPT